MLDKLKKAVETAVAKLRTNVEHRPSLADALEQSHATLANLAGRVEQLETVLKITPAKK